MSGSRPTSRSAPAPAASGRPAACWLEEYPDQLGIALTDRITMDAFLRDFGPEFATRYQGLRHDSGDPVEWEKKLSPIIRSWVSIRRRASAGLLR